MDVLRADDKIVDAVVVGTGLTNCLVSAALARNGEKVIHVDTQANYGDTWMSMSLLELEKWTNGNDDDSPLQEEELVEDEIPADLTAVPLYERVTPYTRRQFRWYPYGRRNETDPSAVPRRISDPAISGSTSVPQMSDPVTPSSASTESPNFQKVTIDLCPKLFFSKSDFIDVCVESSVSRYVDFQGLKSPLTVFGEGSFTEIPTSKSEIFQSKDLTLREKGLLQKFIKSVTESFAFQTPATLGRDKREAATGANHADEREGSWSEWLDTQNLTPRLKDFLIYGICLAQENLSHVQGLNRLKEFTESLMIYGQRCPLLYPMYGSADIGQSFTRIAALHEAVFVLRRKLTHVYQDELGAVRAVRTQVGEVIQCKKLVVPPGVVHRAQSSTGRCVLRLVAVTSRRLFPHEGLGLSVTLPSESHSSAQILQLDESCGVCPSGTYIYHLCAATEDEGNPVLHDIFERLIGEDSTDCIATCSYVHRAITSEPGMPHLTSEPSPLPGFTLHPCVLEEARSLCTGAFLPKPVFVAREEDEERYDALGDLSSALAGQLE